MHSLKNCRALREVLSKLRGRERLAVKALAQATRHALRVKFSELGASASYWRR